MVWIWGVHAIVAVLKKRPKAVKAIYIAGGNWQKIDALLSKYCVEKSLEVKKILNNKIIQVEKKELDKFAGKAHQSIVAEIEQIPFLNLKEWIYKQNEKSFLIACDLIEDPHNLGAIIRTAAAFKADGILITANKQAPFNGTLIKSAAGATEIIPIIKVANLATALRSLQDNQYMVFGLDEAGTTNWDIAYNKRVLVLGQEGDGLRSLTKKTCDQLLAIDTNKEFPTLNVSVAAGIAIAKFQEKN